MVEHALQAASGAGLNQAEFWSSTPYLTRLDIEARIKRQGELALLTGWYAERFAREDRLNSAASYMRDRQDVDPALEAEAEIARWAAGHGLSVVEIEEVADGG